MTDAELAATSVDQIHGEADRWDRDAILILALISIGDTKGAERFWDSLAPRRWRGLLVAQSVESRAAIQSSAPKFWFDVDRQRFGSSGRGYIPDNAIRSAVMAVVVSAKARLRSFTDQMISGGLAIDEWQNVIASQLKSLAVAMAAAGRGGVSRIVATDLTRVSDRLRFQLGRLRRFAMEIERRVSRVNTSEKIEHRAELYAVASEINFHEARRQSHEDARFTQERRVLHPAEHCAPQDGLPSCPQLAEMGWVEIGTLPDPGDGTPCMWNCKCSKEFRRTNG